MSRLRDRLFGTKTKRARVFKRGIVDERADVILSVPLIGRHEDV